MFTSELLANIDGHFAGANGKVSACTRVPLVCDDESLLQMLKSRTGSDQFSAEFIETTLDYLAYLRDPDRNRYSDVLDTSTMDPEQGCDAGGDWIHGQEP